MSRQSSGRLLLQAAVCAMLLLQAALPAYAIVNGKVVSEDQFRDDYPWVVAVIDPAANGICGGALIAPRWVVTAAHCTAEGKYVLLGSPDRSKAQRVELAKVIRHPDFDEQTLQNDVGLLYLQEAVENPVATIMTEAQSVELLSKDVRGVIFGWGSRPYERVPGNELRYARTSLNAPQLRGSQIIRNDPDTGPCGSDSGGPLALQPAAGETVLAGVVSATNGDLCASQGGIAIYTNLAAPAVRKFIDEMLRRFPAQ